MKEIYFTPENVTARAGDLLREGEKHTRSRGLVYRAEDSALLVLDMQAYFLDPDSHAFVPSAPAILPGVQALVEAFKAKTLPVLFTRHTNSRQDAGMMSVWWRDLIQDDSPLGQIVPELEVGDSPVITKHQYDAFHETDLDATLRQAGARQVVVTGVMTHLCCETTARSAFTRGFEVFFPVDGTATYNEAYHRASLTNLAHGFATLTQVGDLISKLQRP